MRSRVFALAAVVLAPSFATAQAPAANVAQFDPKEWEVSYKGRPRDPYADAQGRVWFVGQQGNYIAYLDNKTGQFKRFEIDSGTHPHNLVVEKGSVWFTGNRNGRIVNLDPATGKLKNYMIPDSTVRDPHTMIFDPKTGVAWFTAQQCQRRRPVRAHDRATSGSGRPATAARPYGIVVDSKGQPWFDLFGTNKIGTDRSEDDGVQGVHAPERLHSSSPHRRHVGRPGLLRRLHTRLPRSPRPENWKDPGVGPAARPPGVALCHDLGRQGQHLDRTAGLLGDPGHVGRVRPEDPEIRC